MTAVLVDEALVQPITPETPCGEDLEDTPLLASFDAFRVFGLRTPYDPMPEWGTIAGRATEALCKSKDLRLLAYLGSAVLRTGGLPAFAETLTIASAWLETYWKETYPRIDEDAILRRNALNCFADPIAVIDGLRRLPLVSNRQHGSFSLRDVEIATGVVPADDGTVPADEARIDAAFGTMPREALAELQQSVGRANAALARIAAKMRDDGGGTNAAPSFDPLSLQLSKIDKVLRAQLALRGDGSPEGDGNGAEQPEGASIAGVVRSRQDAIRALDAVSAYFRQHEPSSPLPMLLDRAKRLVSKNFLEVLADIAPEALGQARSAGGLKDGE
ncbi:MAG TPA: type VI secretion system protein TssA [Vicinamibacterales bacterium]|nr:type VI secretion system protein TssA [Vicinamibacterales bacterium]